jgi:hypothetical protein
MTNKTVIDLKGAVHVHTDLSHDGVLSLVELKKLFKSNGFNFVCLTDHSQDVSPEQFKQLIVQCRELADSEFVFIPGLEYSCDGEIHIMGIGIREKAPETEPGRVIDRIHEHGGVAVLSHPTKSSRYLFNDDWVKKLDGAEIWNRSVDSLLVPQAKSIALFARFREINPGIFAMFGLDLHQERTIADIGIVTSGVVCTGDAILSALKEGRYTCSSRFFKLAARGTVGRLKARCFALVKAMFNAVRFVKGLLG